MLNVLVEMLVGRTQQVGSRLLRTLLLHWWIEKANHNIWLCKPLSLPSAPPLFSHLGSAPDLAQSSWLNATEPSVHNFIINVTGLAMVEERQLNIH